MESHKTTATQKKIIDAMEKVYENLIEFKKKKNSDLVVMENGKIARIKPTSL
ncbi:hypothetical protein [Flavobacterium sp. LM4]|uniref:hypothetical protein n=1 Tax=Flavobacterium sp. LM4 TaxID=1938609 RepID=UPI001670E752|nr:hypothetical protein [Flavobacterium sp. LM4]